MKNQLSKKVVLFIELKEMMDSSTDIVYGINTTRELINNVGITNMYNPTMLWSHIEEVVDRCKVAPDFIVHLELSIFCA